MVKRFRVRGTKATMVMVDSQGPWIAASDYDALEAKLTETLLEKTELNEAWNNTIHAHNVTALELRQAEARLAKEQARRVEAEAIIDALCAHEGAEGWSADLNDRLASFSASAHEYDKDLALQVGSIVERRDGSGFRSGAEWWGRVIVGRVEPFTLVSPEGDMVWSTTVKSKDVIVKGQADAATLACVQARLRHDETDLDEPACAKCHDSGVVVDGLRGRAYTCNQCEAGHVTVGSAQACNCTSECVAPSSEGCKEKRMRAENAALSEAEKHVCGLTGYNGMIDPPCPACGPGNIQASGTTTGRISSSELAKSNSPKA